MNERTRPNFDGIHHLKVAVSDVRRSDEFYARALGAERIDGYDRYDAAGRLTSVILEIPGLGTPFELRLNPTAAAAHAGFDPVTFSVDSRRDLEAWAAHFDSVGVRHSPLLAGGTGFLLVFEDPDRLRLRFYTRETHGPEIPPSRDPDWL
jgi:catechol 2,3-dioxygenase-like lactoylglutathione lyase family enzyme